MLHVTLPSKGMGFTMLRPEPVAIALGVLLLVIQTTGCGSSHLVSGKLYYKQQNWPKAAEQLTLALKEAPNDREGHVYLAVCLAELGRFPEAAEHFAKARELSPTLARVKEVDDWQEHYFGDLFQEHRPIWSFSLVSVERPANAKDTYGEYVLSSLPDSTATRLTYEDALVQIDWLPTSSRFHFELKNKTDHTIEILWDRAAFAHPDGRTGPIMHEGVKYVDCSSSNLNVTKLA